MVTPLVSVAGVLTGFVDGDHGGFLSVELAVMGFKPCVVECRECILGILGGGEVALPRPRFVFELEPLGCLDHIAQRLAVDRQDGGFHVDSRESGKSTCASTLMDA